MVYPAALSILVDISMSIQLNAVYNSMVRQFTTSTNDERFDEDFTVAVNNTLDELYVVGDLDDPLSHINSHDASISDLDAEHTGILRSGIAYYLLVQGQMKSGKENHLALARAEWEVAKGNMMVITQRADQADVDSDSNPENPIIGLGVKTPS